MTRSELNRFAGVLPTPCRCGRNSTAANLPLAKSAFANRSLSLSRKQSKLEGEFIRQSLNDVAPAAVRRTTVVVPRLPVVFAGANDEQKALDGRYSKRDGHPKRSNRVLPRVF